eukprot:TRINITY_DN4745_c0_g1_i1.p1 TRINITY_DN4745_c0_g1~~TRINITY_DN4745_c0_g1_i1.p1  ORF type:complete len:223 (-),score=44.88 TRINITY_DN4745_c0_g1_i1:21-689(-)
MGLNSVVVAVVAILISLVILSTPPEVCYNMSIFELDTSSSSSFQDIHLKLKDKIPQTDLTKMVHDVLVPNVIDLRQLEQKVKGYLEEVENDIRSSENLSRYFQDRIYAVQDPARRQVVSDIAYDVAKGVFKKFDVEKLETHMKAVDRNIKVLEDMESVLMDAICSRSQVLKKTVLRVHEDLNEVIWYIRVVSEAKAILLGPKQEMLKLVEKNDLLSKTNTFE